MVDDNTAPGTQRASSRALADYLGIGILTDNRLETLINGKQIFPSMLQAIREARYEICFETFIYWSGNIAEEFTEALCQASSRGVKLYVLLDWWGTLKMDTVLVERMQECGATVCYFNPLRWWQIRRLNYRTHRKILVVDRRIAFTGGVGIADEWLGDARSPEEWHDLHHRITGPVVRDFHEAFQQIWCEVLDNPRLEAARETPEPPRQGNRVDMQVMTGSPRQGSETIYNAFHYALQHARHSILLTTAYLVPDRETVDLMIQAAQRGVDFRIIVPGERIDRQLVRYASSSTWGTLLKHGIQIHVYEPTMLHAKMMIVDDDWMVLGSANFDNRSFMLNDEIIVIASDPRTALEHRNIFEFDSQRCHALDHGTWKRRGLWRRIGEWFADHFRVHL